MILLMCSWIQFATILYFWSPSSSSLFFDWENLNKYFYFFGVICQFKLFSSSWFNLGKRYLLKKSIYSRLFNFMEYKFIVFFLTMTWWFSGFLWVYCYVPFFASHFFLIWIFSLWLLIRLDKGLSILLVFSNN